MCEGSLVSRETSLARLSLTKLSKYRGVVRGSSVVAEYRSLLLTSTLARPQSSKMQSSAAGNGGNAVVKVDIAVRFGILADTFQTVGA
jgi:hypothetical protein